MKYTEERGRSCDAGAGAIHSSTRGGRSRDAEGPRGRMGPPGIAVTVHRETLRVMTYAEWLEENGLIEQ